MDKNNINLSYYEVMILLYEFEEYRTEENNYIALLVEQFYDYFLEQIEQNTKRGMLFNIPDIVIKNLKIYSISSSLYEILINLTGLNLQDKKLKKYYKKYISIYEQFIYQNEVLNVYKKLLKKKKDN